MRGWALAEQGLAEEGILQLCQGLANWRVIGVDGLPRLLASWQRHIGKVDRPKKGCA